MSEGFEDGDNLAKAQPNTWLTSNSNLSIADAILSEEDEKWKRASFTFGGKIPPRIQPPPDAFVRLPLNAYSIFDLSTLSESILLADKIAVLPGNGVYSETGRFLKDNGILEVVDDYQKRDLFDLITVIRGQAPDDLLSIIDKEVLAKIFCHTFGITKETALKALNNTTDWAIENSASPKWTNWFSQNLDDPEILFLNPPQDIISEVFWRTIVYLCVGSLGGYNYYPDSVRAPIVAYILHQIQHEMRAVPVGQELINAFEKQHGRIREKYLNRRSAHNWIEIDIPAALTYILERCTSKSDFLTEAIKLRNDRNVKKFRSWIASLDKAIRSNNAGEYFRLLDLAEEVSNDSTLLNKTPFYIDALPSISFSPTSVGVSIPTDRYGKHLLKYFRTRRLAFFSDLSKSVYQVASIKHSIERVFRSSIPEEQLRRFRELRAYQDGYLSSVLKQKIDSEPIPTTNNNINIAQKRLADGSISIDEYDKILSRLRVQ